MRPFLKWAGGKHRIINQIKSVLPTVGVQRLIEPFVGSGAVFLNTDYPSYLLADANADLINLYRTLKREGPRFIEECKCFFTPAFNTATQFYRLRQQFNATADAREKSALFLYLNRHCFNGLCRYNAKGEFNVPFGRYKKPYFPEEEMHFFHVHAQKVTFEQSDFERTLALAQQGDAVYCDPPYVPLSDTANFTSYSANRFTLAQQERLACLAAACGQRGVTAVISNHDTPFTRSIYAGAAHILAFDVRRSISRDGANRQKAQELLAVFA